MTRVTRNWRGIAFGAVVIATVLAFRQHALHERRAAVEDAREQQRRCELLRAEQLALRQAQPSPGELDALRTDRAAIDALRAEVRALRDRRGSAPPAAAMVPEKPACPLVPVSAWKNAGHATPEATLETALWAAATGDVDALAQLLLLEPDARQRAQALLDRLPDAARAQYTTPERLVALLTAKQVPLGAMQLVATMPQGPETRLLRVRLHSPEGWARTTSVAARGAAGDWRLVVPGPAVDRLAAQLQR
jgi:hypothetical protein